MTTQHICKLKAQDLMHTKKFVSYIFICLFMSISNVCPGTLIINKPFIYFYIVELIPFSLYIDTYMKRISSLDKKDPPFIEI